MNDDHLTEGCTIPLPLQTGAEAFKRLVVAIDQHIQRTPEDADDFDFFGCAQLTLAKTRALTEGETLGFMIALSDFLALLKGAGEPVDDFNVVGLEQFCSQAPNAGRRLLPDWGDSGLGSSGPAV